MKKLLIALILLAGSVYAYNRVHWEAQICGNYQVPFWQVPEAVERVHKQGCADAVTYQLPYDETHGEYVVYGVKIVPPPVQ